VAKPTAPAAPVTMIVRPSWRIISSPPSGCAEWLLPRQYSLSHSTTDEGWRGALEVAKLLDECYFNTVSDVIIPLMPRLRLPFCVRPAKRAGFIDT